MTKTEYDLDINSSYDSDSSIGESMFSELSTSSSVSSVVRSNSSILSSVSNYRFENNRRYHSYRDGHWMLPNDQRECDRMDIIHQMMSLLFNGELCTSPLHQPRRILDIGTGTGVWAIEMAYKFQTARVIGTDLSRIQVSPPPNCTFEVEDADSADWLWPPNSFDMIHTRQLAGGISNWSRFMRQAFTHTRPGGWVELHETPAELLSDRPNTPRNIPLFRLFDTYNEAFKQTGKTQGPDEIYRFEQYMQDAGFVDVTQVRYRLPIGPWPQNATEKEIGRLNWLNFLEGTEAYVLAAGTRVLGMSFEDIQDLVHACQADILNKEHRLYHYLVVTKGRKPLPEEVLGTPTG